MADVRACTELLLDARPLPTDDTAIEQLWRSRGDYARAHPAQSAQVPLGGTWKWAIVAWFPSGPRRHDQPAEPSHCGCDGALCVCWLVAVCDQSHVLHCSPTRSNEWTITARHCNHKIGAYVDLVKPAWELGAASKENSHRALNYDPLNH